MSGYTVRRIERVDKGADTSGRYASIALVALWVGGVIVFAILFARKGSADRTWLPIRPPPGPFDGLPGRVQCGGGALCNPTGNKDQPCPAFYQLWPPQFGENQDQKFVPVKEYTFELPKWGDSIGSDEYGTLGTKQTIGVFKPQVESGTALSGYRLKSFNFGLYGERDTNKTFSTVYNLRWVRPYYSGFDESNSSGQSKNPAIWNLASDYASNIRWNGNAGAYASEIWALGADPERVALQITFESCRFQKDQTYRPLCVQRRLGLNGFWSIDSGDVMLWPGLSVTPCVGNPIAVGIPACENQGSQGWSGLRGGASVGLMCAGGADPGGCGLSADQGYFFRPKAETTNKTFRLGEEPGHAGKPTAFFVEKSGGVTSVSSQDFLNGKVFIKAGCVITASLVSTFWGTWPEKFHLVAGPRIDPAPYDHGDIDDDEDPFTGMDDARALDNLREYLRQICDGGSEGGNWLGSPDCSGATINEMNNVIKYLDGDPCDGKFDITGCPSSNSPMCRAAIFEEMGWGNGLVEGGNARGGSNWTGGSILCGKKEDGPDGNAKYPLPRAFQQARYLAELGVPCWRCGDKKPSLPSCTSGSDPDHLELVTTTNARGGPYRQSSSGSTNGLTSTTYPKIITDIHWRKSGHDYIHGDKNYEGWNHEGWENNDLRLAQSLTDAEEPEEELCLDSTCRDNLCRQGFVAVDIAEDPTAEPDYECQPPSVVDADSDKLRERLLDLNPCEPITMKLTGAFWLEYCPLV